MRWVLVVLVVVLAPVVQGEDAQGIPVQATPPAPSAATPAAISAAPPGPVLTLGGLTTNVMQSIHEDGTTDARDLQALLQVINQEVAAHSVLGPDRNHEGQEAQATAPLSETGWRLWVFWAADAPDCRGLASALVQVRASRLAAIRPVHLCSLRHWEGWMLHMEQFRQAELAAARAQDPSRCLAVYQAWMAEVQPFNAMISGFYQRGVGLMGDAESAVVLQVDHVPAFRLISPAQRIHALDGFGPDFDLVQWIGNCQSWEVQYDAKQEGR